MPIIKKVVKLVGAGVGAARESYLTHQEDKARATASGSSSAVEAGSSSTGPPQQLNVPEGQPPPYVETSEEHAQQLIRDGKAVPVEDSDSDSEDELEEQWRLDEAADAIDPPAYEEQQVEEQDNTKLVAEVLRIAPPATSRRGPLQMPVVLPQRRPRTKSRGFVRAYAPLLNDCAIDQNTFLAFLKNFHLASQASKGLTVIFLAATIAGVVPEMITQIVTTVVQVGAGTAIEIQRRYRANAFLDEMNQKLFIPRGLFALVVAYKPDAQKAIEVGEYDPNQSIAKYSQPAGSGWKDKASKLRSTSGKNFGELEIGEVAPLVYPSIEEAREGQTEQQKSKWKAFQSFMGDYGDRRAQAEYQHKNPNSALGGQEARFKSRYADPNHPANSGSIISLITGGAVNPLERKQQRKQARRERRAARTGRPVKQRGEGSKIKKALQENVAYLLIVNMPSEQEMAEARAKMAAAALQQH